MGRLLHPVSASPSPIPGRAVVVAGARSPDAAPWHAAAHALSDVFGEAVLFCLDSAVNQATGKFLWRVFDDVWFWSREHSVTVKAWKEVTAFAAVTGTCINEAKTGVVRVAGDADTALGLDESLPRGQIRWGVSGTVAADRPLRDRPDHGWTLTWRAAPPAARQERQRICLHSGMEHLRGHLLHDQLWYAGQLLGRRVRRQTPGTHGRIQRLVFSDGDGGGSATSVVQRLKQMLLQRFGVNNVPDGYLFFPAELGGLALQSPFVPLLQVRASGNAVVRGAI